MQINFAKADTAKNTSGSTKRQIVILADVKYAKEGEEEELRA